MSCSVEKVYWAIQDHDGRLLSRKSEDDHGVPWLFGTQKGAAKFKTEPGETIVSIVVTVGGP
jgi:hypothetical protein